MEKCKKWSMQKNSFVILDEKNVHQETNKNVNAVQPNENVRCENKLENLSKTNWVKRKQKMVYQIKHFSKLNFHTFTKFVIRNLQRMLWNRPPTPQFSKLCSTHPRILTTYLWEGRTHFLHLLSFFLSFARSKNCEPRRNNRICE